MAGVLESLVLYHSTLRELSEAREKLAGIPEWMQDLHREHEAKQAEIDEALSRAEEADRQQREAEATVADSQTKLAHYQEQIGRVATQREYGALLKEIDTVKDLIAANESAALTAVEVGEEAREEHRALEEAFQDLAQRYRGELEKWESQKPEVEKRVGELEARCKKIRKSIPRPHLVLFERIRERFPEDTMAPARRKEALRGNPMYHCAACSYSIRPQVIVELQRGENVHTCASCKRILYLESEASD